MRCSVPLLASLLFLFATAVAGAPGGPSLNGVGRFEQLREVQFMAALYSDSPATSAAGLLAAGGRQRIEIHVVKARISAKRFRQWWVDGVAINNPAPVVRRHIDNLSYFTGLFAFKLVRGDRIVIARSPGSGVEFIVNTETIGRVTDLAFFNLLLSSWIGEVSLSTHFRAGLLAGGDVDAALLAQFNRYTPEPGRVGLGGRVWPHGGMGTAETAAVTEADSVVAPLNESPATASMATGLSAAPTAEAVAAGERNNGGGPPANGPVLAAPPLAQSPRVADVAAPPPQAGVVELLPVAPTPPAGGVSAAALLQRRQYVNEVLTRTNRHSRYPRRALATRQQGLVMLDITLESDGRLKRVTVVQASAHSLLNKAAVRAVKKASPFPPPPASQELFSLTVPVSFKLLADTLD